MACSEQGGGFVVLLALAFFVGSVVPLTLPSPEPQCVTVTGYEYVGRDYEGRPEWRYPTVEVCYE